ncbi:speckle-type POZ protein-like [Leptopilina boulardi]|uniref:speckle-type POZ protein-like n=1 Tax=Leptopilina boulardi TaxID=63433 RepID=UPI0021F648A4|nr:speckle-type POZ protein-like [Leptopilina boulardi]
MPVDEKTFFKWIIPDYCYARTKVMKSQCFKMKQNPQITWYTALRYVGNNSSPKIQFCLHLDNTTSLGTDIVNFCTSLSILDSSNHPVFTLSRMVSFNKNNINEIEVSFGDLQFSIIKNYFVKNELILFYKIDMSYKSNIQHLQLQKDEFFITVNKFNTVTLHIGNKTINANKEMLKAKSLVFNKMFSIDMEESVTNDVNVIDIDYDVFVEVLRFIYTGKIGKSDNLSMKILKAAHFYQITDLITICEEILSINLNYDNVIDVLIIADKCSVQLLTNTCLLFIIQHFKKLQGSKKLKDLPYSVLQEFIVNFKLTDCD